MVTIEVGVGGLLIGFFLGLAIAFLSVWLADRDTNKSNEEPSAFSRGFDAGWRCGGEYAEGKLKEDLRYQKPREEKK